jgi:hypothetical protein
VLVARRFHQRRTATPDHASSITPDGCAPWRPDLKRERLTSGGRGFSLGLRHPGTAAHLAPAQHNSFKNSGYWWCNSSRNSPRVRASVLKMPRMAEVIVWELCFCTPRITMQRCEASMTTATP